MSQKEVDRKIGVRPGYLSQVMIGRLDLKLKHLLRALEAIGVDSGGFFELAFPSGDASEPGRGDLLNLLPASVTDSATARRFEEASDEEFEDLVAQALADELGIPLSKLRKPV